MTSLARSTSSAPTAGSLWQQALDAAAAAVKGNRSVASRSPAERRKYADDPWAYFRDVLGAQLTDQQDQVLEGIVELDRVAVQSANNVGKTYLTAGCGVWLIDSRGALEGDGVAERGARLLLPGPSLSTIRVTVWSEMLRHIARARGRGYLMPGRQFKGATNSTLWHCGPSWEVEAMSPPRKSEEKEQQAHSAAGRHAEEQWAICEEAAGMPPALWNAVLGMCSGYGNKILAAWNPTEQSGYAHQLTRGSGWKIFILSTLDHPNVLARSPIIPAAISHRVLDEAVADECDDRGPYPGVRPNPDYDDILYALPPGDTDHDLPRDDGVRGHRDGQIRVYRPRGQFAPRRLGLYPKASGKGLFDAVAWDKGVERSRATEDPPIPPDRIGVDVAEEGDDDPVVAPAWGRDQDSLLAEWQEAASDGNEGHLKHLQETSRIRVGSIVRLAAGRAPLIAAQLVERWPRSSWVIEDVAAGKSTIDHSESVLGHAAVVRWNPSGAPPEGHPLDEEILCGNRRAACYVRAAMLVSRGLVDPPDDPRLREEIMAMELRFDRTRKVDGEDRQVAYLISKKWLKHRLGRSPDHADAFILSLCEAVIDKDDGEFLF